MDEDCNGRFFNRICNDLAASPLFLLNRLFTKKKKKALRKLLLFNYIIYIPCSLIHSSKIVFYSLLSSEALNSKNKEHVNDQQRPCVEPTCGIVANYPHSYSSSRQLGEPKLSYGGRELNYRTSVQEGGFDKEILVGFKRIGFDLLCDCSHYHGHKQTQ